MIRSLLAIGMVLTAVASLPAMPKPSKKILVAHRGASGYAPEHTREAYLLAIEQKSDYVEQDLQITKDGRLVCLHDLTLERTTNAAEVFPDRFREDDSTGKREKHWYVVDFTLEEIKRLDAGSWFDKKFAGTKVLTFQEAIDLVRGKAGIYPETKSPEVYGKYGFDMVKLVMDALKANGLDKPKADPKTPVIIQSFSSDSLKRFRELGCKLELVYLIDPDQAAKWLSREGLKEAKGFADGIGPYKKLILENPQIVKDAHKAGLTVTPFTFRLRGYSDPKELRAEMTQFLYTFDVDAVFTDNPDQFPRSK